MHVKIVKPLVLLIIMCVMLMSVQLNTTFAQQEDPTATDEAVSAPEIDQATFTKGQEAIAAYLSSIQRLNAQGTVLTEGDSQYEEFLFDVLNDHHPTLTASPDQNQVVYYATTFLGLEADTVTPNVVMGSTWQVHLPLIVRDNMTNAGSASSEEPALLSSISYNRTAAVNYANTWVAADRQIRNSAYPNFTSDCTNFTSQVAFAGGIRMAGDGSCRDENNPREWYVKRLNQNCGWPWQSLRNWAWSKSWSVVADFRTYMRDQRVARVVEAYSANNEAVSLLISRARPGDFIQYDVRECSFWGCSWRPNHGVVVVQAVTNRGYYNNDLLVNDHSGGANNTDTVRGSLRSKFNQWERDGITSNRRMVWIRMP